MKSGRSHWRGRLCFFLLGILVFGSSCGRLSPEGPEEELPFYGGKERSQRVIERDQEYLESVYRQTENDAEALQKVIADAEVYYARGYYELATMRFNQAWLLDPENPEVHRGFGMLFRVKGQWEEAFQVFRDYLVKYPDHPRVLSYLARLHQERAAASLSNFGTRNWEEAKYFFEQAYRLYERAGHAAVTEEDRDFVYYHWAVLLALTGDFEGAWEKVRLSREHGGRFIEDEFIEALSKDMPDPGKKEEAVAPA